MMIEYMSKGIRRDRCLAIVGMSKSEFYHESAGKKSGRAPTTHTKWRNPKNLEVIMKKNDEVLLEAIHIKLDPDQAKWYHLITDTLKIRGYYLNHKKVYRLMKEYTLLEERPRPIDKTYVKYKRVTPIAPLQSIEMDIKHIWIYEKRKYAFVFTILDTFTRYALHWKVGYSMQCEQIQEAWEYVIANYIQQRSNKVSDIHVTVRSDNGPQFEARSLRAFFNQNNIQHEFTHPYTPEENGHIESFHSILTDALTNDRFSSLEQLETRLIKFYTTYNNDRSHSGTKGIPPSMYWALFDLGKIEVKVDESEKKNHKVWLKVAYQDILTIPGIKKYHYRVI